MAQENSFTSFDNFKKHYNKKISQLVLKKIPNNLETPLSAFLKIAIDRKNSFLYESVQDGKTKGRYSIIGLNPDKILKIKNKNTKIYFKDNLLREYKDDPIKRIRNFIKESTLIIPKNVPTICSGIFGYLGYEFVNNIEKLPSTSNDEMGLPDGILLRPSIVIIFDSITKEISICLHVRFEKDLSAVEAYKAAEKRINNIEDQLLNSKPKTNLNFTQEKLEIPNSNKSKEDYFAMVRKAKEYIIAGDIFQVVPSQRFSVKFEPHPFLLYHSLRRINPSPYMYYIQLENFHIVGSSPETLVKVEKGKVIIKPIAGTRLKKKGKEQEVKKSLLSDPKERAEHLMLLDLGRNDVGRVSKIGSVNVKDSFIIQETSHLYHIASYVEGELKEDEDHISALCAGFPAGTVSGAPKIRAMEIINELEENKRGLYAGAIGYFSSSGDMDTAITLRTAVIKDKIMYVQAGGGVVYDSKEDYEYNETLNKAQVIFSAAEDVLKNREKMINNNSLVEYFLE